MFLSLLAGSFLGTGIGFYQNLGLIEGQTGFYGTEERITREELTRFLSESPEETRQSIPEIVLFRQEEGILAENTDVGRNAEVAKIEAAGVMHLITPGRLVSGSFVTDSDSDGCVITCKTAEELFGSQECVGESFVIEGKKYIVRGILKGKERLCMVQGEEGKAYPFIRVWAPGIPVSYVRQLLSGLLPELAAEQGDGSGNIWVSEGDLYLGIGRVIAGIPVWVAFILALCRCRRRLEKYTGLQGEIARIALWISGFAGTCGILLLTVHFSDDYIPTAWSDFEFWTELFVSKAGEIHRLLEGKLMIADQGMLYNLAGVAIVSVLESGILIYWLLKSKPVY